LRLNGKQHSHIVEIEQDINIVKIEKEKENYILTFLE